MRKVAAGHPQGMRAKARTRSSPAGAAGDALLQVPLKKVTVRRSPIEMRAATIPCKKMMALDPHHDTFTLLLMHPRAKAKESDLAPKDGMPVCRTSTPHSGARRIQTRTDGKRFDMRVMLGKAGFQDARRGAFPKSVDAAVRLLMTMVPSDERARIAGMAYEDFEYLHLGLAMWIRNNLAVETQSIAARSMWHQQPGRRVRVHYRSVLAAPARR